MSITIKDEKITIELGAKQGIAGAAGKSKYQSYLDTTADDPVLTEAQYAAATGSGAITSTTPTSFTGLLKGTGSNVAVATAGTDYMAPGSVPSALDDLDTNVTGAELDTLKSEHDALPTFGTAAQSNTGDFATLAQGTKADSALQPADVVDSLTSTSTSAPVSANQARALKGLIDNINTLLSSDETTLDTLQEVVDFIELNRTDLDSLGISSIAGLQTALNGKQTSDATLDALSGLTTAANKLVYFTGVDAAASADFTAYARTLLALASKSAVQTELNFDDGADATNAANVTAAGALMDSEVTNLADVKAFDPADYAAASAPFWTEVVLTASKADIAAGIGVATLTHTVAGTITGLKLVCDPANEPSAAAVQVDMNSLNLSTGAATSRLSAVASIATGANISTGGTISGTQTVAFGDQTSFDIDQGSDGKELRALVQITPS